MPYTQEISRANKACFLFLLDQSFSMTDPIGGSSEKKHDALVTAINGWLQNMGIRATDKETKDWMDVGVIGYRTDQQGNPIIESPLQGPLAGRMLVSIAEIAANPAEFKPIKRRIPDEETGEVMELDEEVPVWVGPMAEGGTPMCHALLKAHEILTEWIEGHSKSFPPVVIHITDGESQDGDPIPYAEALTDLETDDGKALLFNCHLSETAADAFMFPVSDEVLPDDHARTLFKMSSPIPEAWVKVAAEAAKQQGTDTQIPPNARGMAYNVHMVELIRFIDMGTRPAAMGGLR